MCVGQMDAVVACACAGWACVIYAAVVYLTSRKPERTRMVPTELGMYLPTRKCADAKHVFDVVFVRIKEPYECLRDEERTMIEGTLLHMSMRVQVQNGAHGWDVVDEHELPVAWIWKSLLEAWEGRYAKLASHSVAFEATPCTRYLHALRHVCTTRGRYVGD